MRLESAVNISDVRLGRASGNIFFEDEELLENVIGQIKRVSTNVRLYLFVNNFPVLDRFVPLIHTFMFGYQSYLIVVSVTNQDQDVVL